MAILDFFSKRQKRESGSAADVYSYDEISEALRVQIVYILVDVIGRPNVGGSPANTVYETIHHALVREYGLIKLAAGNHDAERLFNFIGQTPVASQVLDAIEVALNYAEYAHTQNDYRYGNVLGFKMSVQEGAEELNIRFQEAAVGYQYESGNIIRIDSQVVHAEIVKPALVLLSDSRYGGAQEEFLKAHKDYREGDYKGCLTECLKAFESTMKSICDIRKWPYNKTDTARQLIEICFRNGLVLPMLQAQFNSLQNVLESGVPTLRNKMGGHGQGAVPTQVPAPVAAYTLHLTAANIVLLTTSERRLP